jgi:hypothetical protein
MSDPDVDYDAFLDEVQNHPSMSRNQTANRCIAAARTARVIALYRHTERMECCFTHKRSGNVLIQLVSCVDVAPVVDEFVARPVYGTMCYAIVLLANAKEYIDTATDEDTKKGIARKIHEAYHFLREALKLQIESEKRSSRPA